jgi:hypothetical protein
MIKNDEGPKRPPVISSWSWLYVAVLLNLALQILLFYLLTKAFR